MTGSELKKAALRLGWTVVDLNDNERGIPVRGPSWRVKSAGGLIKFRFDSEDQAWRWLFRYLRGDVLVT